MWKGNQPRYATPTSLIAVQGHLSRGGILKDMGTDPRVLCDVQFRMSDF